MTHSTDLLPTLAELAGLKLERPANFDGQCLVSLLEGHPEYLIERKLVIQYGPEFKLWDSAVLWKHWRLVKGEELYNLASDPGQETNIAGRRPDVVSILRTHYLAWARKTQPIMGRENFILVGSPAEKVTVLSAADWVGPYCGDWDMLNGSGPPLLGHWNVEVEMTGDYEISLYLFPPEANIALNRSFRNVIAKPVASAFDVG